MNQAMMMKIRKMQKQLQEAQEKLQNSTFIGKSGGICSVEVRVVGKLLKLQLIKMPLKVKKISL